MLGNAAPSWRDLTPDFAELLRSPSAPAQEQCKGRYAYDVRNEKIPLMDLTVLTSLPKSEASRNRIIRSTAWLRDTAAFKSMPRLKSL